MLLVNIVVIAWDIHYAKDLIVCQNHVRRSMLEQLSVWYIKTVMYEWCMKCGSIEFKGHGISVLPKFLPMYVCVIIP